MRLRFYILRDGIVREDLELYAIGSPKILMDAAADIKTSLRGSFQKVEGVNLLSDHIVSMMDGQGCGEFVVCSCVRQLDGGCEIWQIEAYDQAVLLARSRLESPLFISKGTLYMDVIQQLLADCGLYRIQAERCDEQFLCDREWEIGCDRLYIIQQLLEEMGFDPLYFDSDGYARLHAYRPPDMENIVHIYRHGEAHLQAECSSSWDVFEAKNVFVAVADSPYQPVALRATASNDDPNSAISTVHLGRVMAPVMVLENVASQAALQAFVDRVRDESLLSAEEVCFYSDLAIHQIGEPLALEHPQLEGIYRETAWEMDLAENTMKHTGRRLSLL